MALNAYLKLDGLDGESTDKAHPNEIEIMSFSWGVSNPSSVGHGGGGGQGRAVLQDFHFAMGTSKASPSLMLYCATGRHIRFATLSCRRGSAAGGFEFLKIKLSECLVSDYEIGSHVTDTDYSLLAGNENDTTDQLSLRFERIDYQYTVERTREIVTATFTNEDPNT